MSDKEKKAALSEEKATKKEKKANAADSGKSKKEKDKKSVFKRIAAWFKDLKKDVWPTKKSVFNNTLVVLCVVIVGSVVIGLLDLGFLNLMQFLMGLSK